MTDSTFLATGLMLACAASVCAALSFWMVLGFVAGVAFTLVAGAIAGTGLEP